MLFGDYVPLSDNVRRALRYAPAAALTAIVVPDLLPWKAGLGPVFDYKLVAGVLAVLVFLRTRSAVLVIIVGMLVLWGCAGWRAEPTGAVSIGLAGFCPSDGRFADRIRPPRRFSGRFGHSATCFARAPGRLR